MKSKRNILMTALLLILSLSLLIACKAETTPSPAIKSTVEATKDEQPKEQSKETPKEETPTEVSADTVAEVKPEESQESTEAAPNSTEKPVQESNSDSTSLQIEGSGVEKATVLSLDELKAMKDAYLEDDFFSINSYGTKEYFSFKGIKLSAVLEKAGLKKNAAVVKFVASDGYEQEITIEQALRVDYIDEQNPDKRYSVIIAWHENGEDYDAAKGAPFRLVIGQKEPGDVNKPQWVQNVAKIIVD